MGPEKQEQTTIFTLSFGKKLRVYHGYTRLPHDSVTCYHFSMKPCLGEIKDICINSKNLCHNLRQKPSDTTLVPLVTMAHGSGSHHVYRIYPLV